MDSAESVAQKLPEPMFGRESSLTRFVTFVIFTTKTWPKDTSLGEQVDDTDIYQLEQ